MNENKCYFPSDITIEKEFLTGFGKKELRQTLKGGFGSLLVALICYTIYPNVLLAMTIFIVGTVGAGMLCIRSSGMNMSFVDHVANMITYMKCQKAFLFQYFDEWRNLE